MPEKKEDDPKKTEPNKEKETPAKVPPRPEPIKEPWRVGGGAKPERKRERELVPES